MYYSLCFSKVLLCLILLALSVKVSLSKSRVLLCGEIRLVALRGVISSPHYPIPSSQDYSCTWHILSPPESVLTIHLWDLDVAEDPDCITPPCCRRNWLSLPIHAGSNQQLCGRNVSIAQPIKVSQSRSTIKFHYNNPTPSARGFSLTYSIEKKGSCAMNEFQCSDGTCLPLSMKCDRVAQCTGGEDELHCPNNSYCPKGEILCSLRTDRCFKPEQRCDGLFQCLYGEDEVGCVPGCEHGITCSSGEGCYYPMQRCDSRSDCSDESDEAACPPELCAVLPDKRQCRNGRCLQAQLWCDGSNDCGDSSDEESCLMSQNSVITAAMMGALLGGLLLVLAVGCTLRIYGQRHAVLHLSPPLASRLRMSHSVSLPALIDDEFFHREPPPAYSVAVGDVGSSVAGTPRRSRGRARGRPLLSVRRQQGSRERHTLARPKPPTALEAMSEVNSVQSSLSHDNLVSSAPTSATSSDDNIHLISA